MSKQGKPSSAGASRSALPAGQPRAHGGSHAGAGDRRVLLLRERIRAVRDDTGPGAAALRLGLIAASVAGAVLGIWTLGYLGFRLGVAPILGATEILGEPGEGLATGALAVLRAPMAVLGAGLAQPGLLIAGFVMIAIPASLLPLARPMVRGGPRPSDVESRLSAAGAAAAIFFAALLVAWSASPLRRGWVGPMPATIADSAAWTAGIDAAAGIDLLAAVTAVLWAIVVLRFAIPTWLRWLSGAVVYFALMVVLISTATSNAVAAHVDLPRAVVRVEGEPSESLLLGYTREHAVLLSVENGKPRSTLVVASRMPIVGRRSLREALAAVEE